MLPSRFVVGTQRAHVSGPGPPAQGSEPKLATSVSSSGIGRPMLNWIQRSHQELPCSSATVSVRSHTPSIHEEPLRPTVVKDISFWGGLALLICNTTGPGSVSLPLVAQNAGWVPTVVGYALIGTLSYLSSVFICEAMTLVPGNDHFQANVEFSNLVLCFFGRRYQILSQIVCFLALQTTIIASIAICSQVFDNLLIQIFHRTCGIQVSPSVAFVCATELLPTASPFSGILIISTGAMVAMVMIIPLCLMNLSENIWLQLGSCIVILVIFAHWIVTFFIHGLDISRVPAVGKDVSQAFGSILFNYVFITAVPSWANAKQPQVSAQKTVGTNITLMTCIFILVTILGAMAYEIPENSTLIQAINSSPDVTTFSRIAGYTFPIVALVTSIPVNTIVLRYNLIQSGTCNKGWATLLAGGMPWMLAIPGMTGSVLVSVVEWSSLFFISAANFVIPFVLYIYSKKHKEKLEKLAEIENEQWERLSKAPSRSSGISDDILSIRHGIAPSCRRLKTWIRSRALHTSLPTKCEVDAMGIHENVTAPALTSVAHTPISNFEHSREKAKSVDSLGLYHGEGWNRALTFPVKAADIGTSSPRTHSRSRTHCYGGRFDFITPPFLGGNNYTIPGFSKALQFHQPNDSELELYPTKPDVTAEGAISNRELGPSQQPESHLPEHADETCAMSSLSAIPSWFPASGLMVARCALALILIGIVGTIVVKIVQLF
ncbi:hypothetical protein BG011_001111 [Mortierella polycephala]|uniref:Amino acid transporter transmembrane domain-containing protein n=1 Tax=Mortierella polycephala TaxID=41804 RepID=A0A9P6Q801_9FUNG|nr:hypothetical protein BG011_001111 [Mortierella polycephala]